MKKKIFTTVLIVFTLVAAFGVLELVSRFYVKRVRGLDFVYLRHEYDAYRNHRLRPNYQFQGIRHNSQGFRRDRDIMVPKPSGTYRIFLMGASVAYGVDPAYPYPRFCDNDQIANQETVDFYLEGYLNQRFPELRFEVINAAVTGYWTHHHLIYLIQRVLNFEPDMVLFLDGHADYYHYRVGYDQFASYYYSGKHMIDMLNDPSVSTVFYFFLEWASQESYFLYALKTMLNLRYQKEAVTAPTPKDPDDIVATYKQVAKKNFLRMVKYISIILREEGIKAVFLLQPELILKQDKPFTDTEHHLLQMTLGRSVPDINRLKSHTVELMEETTSRYGGVFLDLTNVFSGVSEQAYTDYAHLTPAGNKLLAEYVGDRLVPLINNSASDRPWTQ